MNNKCKQCLDICRCCYAEKCSTCKPFGKNFVKRYNRCMCTNTKFQVGDFVKVRADLKVYQMYTNENGDLSPCNFAQGMEKCKGSIVRIIRFTGSRYKIVAEDGWSDFYWVDGMFEDEVYSGFKG